MSEDQLKREDENMFKFVIDWLTFSALVWIIAAHFSVGTFNIILLIGLGLTVFASWGRAWMRSKLNGSSAKSDPNTITIKLDR